MSRQDFNDCAIAIVGRSIPTTTKIYGAFIKKLLFERNYTVQPVKAKCTTPAWFVMSI
jgi:hypothetical protein